MENKYYDAILRIATSHEFVICDNFSLDAVVLLFHKDINDTFEYIQNQWDLICKSNHCNPTILLCVDLSLCPDSRSLLKFDQSPPINSSSKVKTACETNQIYAWCSKHGFELVDFIDFSRLESRTSSKDLYEDDSLEKQGYERIIEALHSNMWKGLVLKNQNGSQQPFRIEDHLDDDCELASQQGEEEDQIEKLKGLEDFMDLIKTCQQYSNSLDSEHRKDLVEKIAIDFWKMMDETNSPYSSSQEDEQDEIVEEHAAE
eukprot:Sdes_comp14028_c0_seq2m3366